MLNFNYSDFQCGAINGFRFANGGCRNEYRNGLLNVAQSRLFEQDLDKNGVLSLDEYINADNYASDKEDALNCRSNAVLAGSCRDYANAKNINRDMQIRSFRALDVNRDGVLDQRELANEVSLMDTLGNGPNGTADGVVSQKGYERLWCNPNRTPEQAGALLRHNYSKMNMANLGMPWDNCCEQRSRAIGSRYQNEYGQPYYNYGQMGIPYSTNIPVYNNCCGTNGYVNPGYNYPQYVNPLYQGQPVVYNKLQNIMGQLVQIAQMLMSRGYSY